MIKLDFVPFERKKKKSTLTLTEGRSVDLSQVAELQLWGEDLVPHIALSRVPGGFFKRVSCISLEVVLTKSFCS